MNKLFAFVSHVLMTVILRICSTMHSVLSIINKWRTSDKCPMIEDRILMQSATSLAEMIRKKEITSEAVIKAYISRIKAVNPVINAVVEDRFAAAIKEAKEIDNMLVSTKLTTSLEELAEKYPLLGLPLTVKESIAVKDLSHAAGRKFPSPKKANKDADIVMLCKEAGAIPLLVSNTPELCINFECYNKVTGVTKNPYDTRRTPGGSSGGEGALLGAGASLIGLGSDLAGSIRLPAHYCGVWGHKPSASSVSIDGHYPDCPDREIWEKLFILGPMTRYACDLSLVLKVILKREARLQLNLNEKVDLSKLKFYYLATDKEFKLTRNVDAEIMLAMKRLVSHFRLNLSCDTKELKLHEFKHAPDLLLSQIVQVDNVENLFDNGKGSFKELFKYFTLGSDSVLPPILYGITKRLSHLIPPSFLQRNNRITRDVRQKLIDILGKDGILIHPTHTSAANYHGQVYCKFPDYGYTSIFNVLGFPVTNCPLGINSDGLPIGIQIAAAPNNDRLTLAVAQEIEKVFGGWIPPVFSDKPNN